MTIVIRSLHSSVVTRWYGLWIQILNPFTLLETDIAPKEKSLVGRYVFLL